MAPTVPEMLKMSQTQLDDLFTQAPAGEIPGGEARGRAIVARERLTRRTSPTS